MDLVRTILLKFEKLDRPSLDDLLAAVGMADERRQLEEHMQMLVGEAKLADGRAARVGGKMDWLLLRLTWDGHEFLDAARDETARREA